MFYELLCDPIKQDIKKYIIEAVNAYKARGINPKLAVIRAGENPSQIYYENAIISTSEELGIETQVISFPEETSLAYMKAALQFTNADEEVHGIIMLRPFPEHIDEAEMRDLLNPDKDVDAITDNSLVRTLVGKKDVFHACTAEAVLEVLKFYGVKLSGKKVTIIGRSLTVGKPTAMLMLNEDATVTICHSHTSVEDQMQACKQADIVVLATGRSASYGTEYFRNGQIIIDVGSGTDQEGNMQGDLDIEEIKESGKLTDIFYTPVPGGVGKVTTVLLLRNIIKAINKRHNI